MRAIVQSALEHFRLRQFDQAETVLKRALAREPRHPGANQVLALVLSEKGQFDQAIYYIERAIAGDPTFPEFYATLGAIKTNTADLDGALRALAKAVELAPNNASSLSLLGMGLVQKGRPAEGETHLRRAVAIEPGREEPLIGLSRALTDSGRAEEGMAALAGAWQRGRVSPALVSSACMNSNYVETDPARSAELHRAYGHALGPAAAPPPRRQSPGKLRIGYLSPDLREHSVTSFLEPILAAHDRGAFDITCYSVGSVSDATTARLRPLCDRFREMPSQKDDSIERVIRSDGIDILVELAGHTAGGSLPMLMRRPAPVQVTYLGYPNTTGAPAIDYRFVDEVTDPPGADAFATERLVRLPGCFLCYGGPANAPEPRPAPADGPVTFGSFNNPAKISRQTMDLWSTVLREVPDSRVLLKGKPFAEEATRRRIADRFAARGIEAPRIEFLAEVPGRGAHLRIYHRVDVALDTFPYNGATTTCEALWMGVPVVTLRGQLHAARVGASLLGAASMGELVAETPEDFVRLAVELARDVPRRAALASGLRDQLRNSRLCDAAAHARAMEAAYRDVWAAP